MGLKKNLNRKLREDAATGKDPSQLKAEAGDGAAAAGAAPGGDAGATGADHADADQDKALIKKMLADTFGGDVGDDQEACDMAHGMFSGAKKAGESHEEAMNCAKYGMKAAKHNAESKQMESKEDDAMEAVAPTPDVNLPGAGKEAAKEAAATLTAEVKRLRESNTRLTAENLKFKTEREKAVMNQHLDKVCQESKKPVKVTKVFRELCLECKTPAEIDKKWKIFQEAFDSPGSGDDEGGFDFSFAQEKNAHIQESAAAGSAAIGFGDCLAGDDEE